MGIVCSCIEGVRGRQRTAPAALREASVEGFAGVFEGLRPTALGVAPGRVEVLGNHTDYNEGYILSAAIDRYAVVAGRVGEGGTCRIASAAYPGDFVAFDPASPSKQDGNKSWANYVMGVVSELCKAGAAVGGFDAFIAADVPPGAGVSSSAAVEMATAKLLAQLFPATVGKLDDLTLVKMAKAAENNFVGMGCGILDQYTSGMSRAGSLLYLDCRTLGCDYVPFKGAQFVLVNSHAPHALVDGKYNELREHCFSAASAFANATGNAITHLRDVGKDLFEAHQDKLNDKQRVVARHVVLENDRVQQAIGAVRAGDLPKLGTLMSQSHSSSRDDFGNSCPELNELQACAEGIDGLLGSRLMGGGFGGSTISLVEEGKTTEVAEELCKRYKEKTGIQATSLVCALGDGAFAEVLV
mmetsp:Transcript_115099/g.229222  ORF Transcript_115099/g.229222 Transcript_115099/m.229222 type:complete len:413 (-) Transcript_115099:38-1276(-)